LQKIIAVRNKLFIFADETKRNDYDCNLC